MRTTAAGAALALVFLLAGGGAAMAQSGISTGFVSGLMHPLSEPGHVASMVAIGLWGAILGMPYERALPIAFPVFMALGAALGHYGIHLPLVREAVAVSAIVVGGAVALAIRPPILAAAGIVALFAIFHGHAHSAAKPDTAAPLAFAAGFLLTTAVLHVGGLTVGRLAVGAPGRLAVRALGLAVVGIGLWTLFAPS
jgi:urease accessory protein